jgi:hypothetical protein
METGRSPFSRPPQPRPASAYGSVPPAPVAPAPAFTGPASTAPTMAAELRTSLEAQRRRGAQWFYWVAALSLINSVLALAGQEWRFILGLGITQLVQEMAKESGGGGTAAGVVGLVFIGFFAVLGHRAVDGRRWAFVAGMVAYGLDGVIFLLAQHWIGVAFHVFALVMIGKGYVAARQLEPHD